MSDPGARRRHMVDGVLWSGVQTVLGRVVTFGGQLLLAYLLAPAEFGLFAMATAVSAIVLSFQDIGLGQVLLQRRERARLWEGAVIVLSLALGLGTALLMIGLASLAAAAYGKAEVQGLLMVLAVAAPFQALHVVPVQRLQRALRFRRLALLQSVSVCASMALTCVLAALDSAGVANLGPYCFAIPIPVTAGLMLVLYASSACLRFGLPGRRNVRLSRWGPLIRNGAMVFLAGWLIKLVAQGDYMVLGLFFDETVVGLYFMAFTLSNQVISLFGAILAGVLIPSLCHIGSDPDRQVKDTLAAMRVLALIGFPFAFGQALLADPVVRLLLPERWHTIGPMVSLLSIGISFRLMAGPAAVLWLAQGRYRGNLMLNAAYAIAFFGVVGVAAACARGLDLVHPGLVMAGVVTAFFLSAEAIVTYVRLRVDGLGVRHLLDLVIWPVRAALGGFVLAWLVSRLLIDDGASPATEILLRGALFVVAFVTIAWPELRRIGHAYGWDLMAGRIRWSPRPVRASFNGFDRTP